MQREQWLLNTFAWECIALEVKTHFWVKPGWMLMPVDYKLCGGLGAAVRAWLVLVLVMAAINEGDYQLLRPHLVTGHCIGRIWSLNYYSQAFVLTTGLLHELLQCKEHRFWRMSFYFQVSLSPVSASPRLAPLHPDTEAFTEHSSASQHQAPGPGHGCCLDKQPLPWIWGGGIGGGCYNYLLMPPSPAAVLCPGLG